MFLFIYVLSFLMINLNEYTKRIIEQTVTKKIAPSKEHSSEHSANNFNCCKRNLL